MNIEIPEEKKIELIKKAISTKEGWRNLALSVKGNPDAKAQCITFLQKIGGDIEIDIPFEKIDKGAKVTETFGEIVETIKVKFSDLLVQQLETNLSKLNEEE